MKKDFDPNAPGSIDSGLFGLPFAKEEASLVILPVPWEVTTSYGGGTSQGPKAILEASPQLDLYDHDFGNFWESGIALDDEDPVHRHDNDRLRPLARRVIDELEENGALSPDADLILQDINRGCEAMVDRVTQAAKTLLDQGKWVGLVGGDHSTPLGLIQALSEKYQGQFGILHIDAHADLRLRYEGFNHSHASIMRNVMELAQAPRKLVQVGIRDFCEEERDFILSQESRVKTYFDRELKDRLFGGATWDSLVKEVLQHLPENVYVSFDIDGLSPEFCPGTGTPVAGGLSYDQAMYLLVQLARSGKRVIGFDLNEVAPSADSEWDANVGARVLYKLCGTLLSTQASTPR